MKILALETSGVFCSAALLCDGDVLGLHEEAPRRHGERLLPMMEEVLARGGVRLKQLDAIAFGRGPGSFTGVRIAAAVAQGVAFGAGVPLVGISTLAALAHAGWRQHGHTTVLAVIDARIGELYWGLFEIAGQGRASALQPEQVSAAERVDVTAGLRAFDRLLDFGVGNGWSLYRDALIARTGLGDDRIDADLSCTAADIAELAASAVASGETVPPEQGLPVYLRDQVATKPAGVPPAV
ncbi:MULTISPECIES: tRNA (adenosine(37)-N6)-threonylcarbamoyltransferase complex dimerization subunit type 1 TsaB [Thiorhodovibrio]|uniref:tRNA (adenosine(37)-N6)-threonylcarbamoyltransferase complex dimerization subunit type 1 TsaB n=1 Tax=Thiorhodovibrio TaxID=61593 RepID=UPI001914329C|nr:MULTISPECIES: tRNA (adenosine(37)-N6)-threonylcarbamoyltransferase complex dimerization subunit type 1 TsaB [Thiorhodovibrio]MBK5967891.1 tRNA (adenosine(37)-N6)-threonylcarbamoyltransferase complex dimerization subunit type 1 TsaB [Thiorhodovibrio winogradskyi]WPL14117.1 UGMP family protein [Thiorhodovibrio litoralis]